jgi:hypothetical protein
VKRVGSGGGFSPRRGSLDSGFIPVSLLGERFDDVVLAAEFFGGFEAVRRYR